MRRPPSPPAWLRRSTAKRTACSELMLVAAELPVYDSKSAIGMPLGSALPGGPSSEQAASHDRAISATAASRALPRAGPRLGAEVPFLPVPTTPTRIAQRLAGGAREGLDFAPIASDAHRRTIGRAASRERAILTADYITGWALAPHRAGARPAVAGCWCSRAGAHAASTGQASADQPQNAGSQDEPVTGVDGAA